MKRIYGRRFMAVLLAVCILSLGGTARYFTTSLDVRSDGIEEFIITYTQGDLIGLYHNASEGFQNFRNMFILPGIERFAHNCFVGIGFLPGGFR